MPRRLVVLLALAALSSCVRNPATGKRQLNLVSDQQAAELGRQGALEAERTIGTYSDEQLQAYVQSVGEKVAAVSDRPDLPWRFGVLDDPSVNAFSLPGGNIYITRGLLAYLGSEAELAAVLGHEIGHETARHVATQLSQQQLGQAGLLLGVLIEPGLAKYAGLASAGLQLLSLKHSRDDERESDLLGWRYALRAGYDAREMIPLFETLERTGGERGRLPGWLATHPDPKDRIAETKERIARGGIDFTGKTIGRDAYVTRLDGLVFGEDPRKGYFEGTSFYAPELGLALDFPAGWKTRNQANAVLAASPSGDGLLLLGAIGKGTPEEAAQAFAQQQGTIGRPAALSIDGRPAVQVPFRGQVGDAPVEGVSTFVQHGERTFQIVGLAPAGALGRHLASFDAAARSFRTVRDPQKLAVEPKRIDVERLSIPRTLADVARESPSALPLPDLAELNGTAPTEQLPAGAFVKRVTPGRRPG